MATDIYDSLTDHSPLDGTNDAINGAEVDANPFAIAQILDGTTATDLGTAGTVDFRFTASRAGIRLIDTDNAGAAVHYGLAIEWDPGDDGNMTDGSSGVGIQYKMPDDADTQTIYARHYALMVNDAAAADAAEVVWETAVGGTLTVEVLRYGANGFVWNDDSSDLDARFESNGLAYALYIDGGKDALVFGANTDVSSTDTPFLIDYAARTATAATNFDRFKVGGTNAITIPTGTTALVTGAHFAEPNITATGTVTNAATVYIAGAPTEGGSGNYALWVDAGAVQIDGNLAVGGTLGITGAITFTGAVSIDDTTDTTSGTTGSLHTDGGVGIAKALYVGTTVTANTMVLATGSLTDTTGAISFGNENLSTTGTLAAGATTVTGLTFDMSQDYLVTSRGTQLAFQSQTSGAAAGFEFYSKDGDGTDVVSLELWGKGIPTDVTNYERLRIQYVTAGEWQFLSDAAGSGTARGFSFAGGAVDFTDENLTTTGTLAAGATTVTGAFSASSSIATAATARIYLDGIAATGNTYLYESAADNVKMVVGGVEVQNWANNDVTFSGGISTDGQAAPTSGYLGTGAVKNAADNAGFYTGEGDDLHIYHNGTNNVISSAGTAALSINLVGDTETAINCTANGAVTLYYDNAAKLATHTGGITVTGNVQSQDYVSALNGFYVGDIDVGKKLDDASNGAATATLYIGNASINVTSDRRAKRNIEDFSGAEALDLLKQAHVVSFDYIPEMIGDESEYGPSSRGRYVGMIAQEMREWAPWAINAGDGTEGDHLWKAEYDHLVGLLVAAVNHQQDEINTLKARLN